MDFFGVEDEDVNEMSFDRVNLLQTRSLVDIEFSIEEQHIVALVEKARPRGGVEAARLMAARKRRAEDRSTSSVTSGRPGTGEATLLSSSLPLTKATLERGRRRRN